MTVCPRLYVGQAPDLRRLRVRDRRRLGSPFGLYPIVTFRAVQLHRFIPDFVRDSVAIFLKWQSDMALLVLSQGKSLAAGSHSGSTGDRQCSPYVPQITQGDHWEFPGDLDGAKLRGRTPGRRRRQVADREGGRHAHRGQRGHGHT
jgi:hypothetical protein